MADKKVALVTGASRGIGRAVAIKLGQDGFTVIVNYNGSEEKANETVEAIKANGGEAEAVKCSVADFTAVGEMIKEIVAKHGSLDVIVNNAGITKDGLVMAMKEEDFDAVLNTNLKGAFNTIRFGSKVMLKQKSGKIINISSVSGVMGNPGQANYSASKAGVIGLTKSVAKELGSRGICVNAVAPGFIDTDMTGAMTEDAKKVLCDQITLKRTGKPEDIANAVAFLASDAASYITGQVLCVDGGMAY